MAKKNKLTLAAVKKTVGVGEFTEIPVKFNNREGSESEGTVLVKRLSHNERVVAIEAWGLDDKNDLTVDQVTRAYVFAAIYTEPDEMFFPEIDATGDVSPEFMNALYMAAEKVNDFSGKSWIANLKNSGANSLSMVSAEEPLKKQSNE